MAKLILLLLANIIVVMGGVSGVFNLITWLPLCPFFVCTLKYSLIPEFLSPTVACSLGTLNFG